MMKSFKSFRSVLNEKLSSILYHGTRINQAAQILKSGKFKLTKPGRDVFDLEINKGFEYFLSFARSKNSDYLTDTDDNYYIDVIFLIDGDKLNNKHKGGAIDYYWDDSRRDEMEDRLFSNKSEIDIMNVIKEVHVLDEDRGNSNKSEDRINLIYSILESSRKMDIPFYFYTSRNDFQKLNKKCENFLKSYPHKHKEFFFQPDRFDKFKRRVKKRRTK